jgi:adenylate cyclase
MGQMKQGLINFEKYVPSTVVKTMLRKNQQAGLGVIDREISVMFMDIEGFTSLSETMNPSDMVQMMSDFFTAMSDVVMQHNGVIDKYVCIALNLLNNITNIINRLEIVSCHYLML